MAEAKRKRGRPAKRTGVRTKTTKKKTTPKKKPRKRLTPQQKHSVHCAICKSPRREELDTFYKQGVSVYVLERYFGFRHDSIHQHGKMTGIREQRDETVLAAANHFISAGIVYTKDLPHPGLIGKSMELKGKITGELTDHVRHTHEFVDMDDDELMETVEDARREFNKLRRKIAARTASLDDQAGD